MLRPAIFFGTVGSGTANSVTFTTPGLNLAGYLQAGTAYYIEVIANPEGQSDANNGERFEVDEAATAAGANATLVLDAASPLNTAVGAFGALAGHRIALRPHWTLATLFGTGLGATQLNSATSSASADQVLAWNGTSWSTYWFRQNSAGTVREWRNTATGTANQDNALIPSGVGIFFVRRNGGLSLNAVGEIRTNRFVRNLDESAQLLALGHPVDRSPQQLGLDTTAGYTANTTSSASDQLLAWNGSAFSTYWFRRNSAATVFEWRNTATSTTNHTATPFILCDQAYLVRPMATLNDLRQSPPFLP